MNAGLNILVWAVIAVAIAVGTGFVSRRLGLPSAHALAMAAFAALSLVLGVLIPDGYRVRIAREVVPDSGVTGPCASVPVLPGVGSLDVVIDSATNEAIPEGGAAGHGSGLSIQGWAVLNDRSGTSRGVCVFINDQPLNAPIRYGDARPDVAKALGSPALLKSGYAITIPPGTLPPGSFTIAVGSIEADGHTTLVSSRTVAVQ